jgi:hypothetical protein
MGRRLILLAMGIGFAASVWGAGPEGAGNASIDYTYVPQYSGQAPNGMLWDANQCNLALGYDLVQGIGVRSSLYWSHQYGQLGGTLVYFTPPSTFTNVPATQKFTDDMYEFNFAVDLYLAGLRGQNFKPGNNANPDGWILWPSLTLGYQLQDNNTYHAIDWGGAVNATNASGFYSLGNYLQAGLTWPLATWLTVDGFHQTDLSLTGTNTLFPGATTTNFRSFRNGVGASCYLDLVHGAGSDMEHGYIPHVGRLGQMAIKIAGVCLSTTNGINRWGYSLQVQAPVSDSLAVGLDLGRSAELDGVPADQAQTTCGISLMWAFGDLKGRTD